MSETFFNLVAVAFLASLLIGMVMVFARRTPWFAPYRDPRVSELTEAVKKLSTQVAALTEAQQALLRRLEARESEGPRP